MTYTDRSPPVEHGWEEWLAARLAAERQVVLEAVVAIVGDALGNTLADAIEHERAQWQRELAQLRTEAAKLSSTCDELHRMLADDRRKTVVDLPSLSSMRSVN